MPFVFKKMIFLKNYILEKYEYYLNKSKILEFG